MLCHSTDSLELVQWLHKQNSLLALDTRNLSIKDTREEAIHSGEGVLKKKMGCLDKQLGEVCPWLMTLQCHFISSNLYTLHLADASDQHALYFCWGFKETYKVALQSNLTLYLF